MSYTVKFTETNNAAKAPIIVADQTINTQTDVTFVGKNYAGYGPLIAENFLHLLENYASPSAPATPVQGQLWFDNTSGTSQLKVNIDGTANGWQAAGNVRKAAASPDLTNSIQGDLWVDTVNQQLNLYTGSQWLLVGPTYSAGVQTGPKLESFADVNNVTHVVQSIFVNNNRAMVISDVSFIPKTIIAGFDTIAKGVNVYTDNTVGGAANSYKFNGIITQANALTDPSDSTTPVSVTNLLRTDKPNTTNYPLTIKNASGLTLGSDTGSLSIFTDTNNTAAFYAKTGNSIEFRVNYSNSGPATVVHIDSNKFVGINKSNPTQSLDVAGTVQVDTKVAINGTADDSFETAGGIRVTGVTTLYGTVNLIGGNNSKLINLGSNIQPNLNEIWNIGSDPALGGTNFRLNSVYAKNFYGTFNGTFSSGATANVSVSGSATRLAQAINLYLDGDVSSNVIVTDGSNITSFPTLGSTGNSNSTIKFTTSLATGSFSDPAKATGAPQSTDIFLFYRPGQAGLNTITRSNLVSGLQVPVGTILPYAGTTLPPGFLWCDGSEVTIKEYGTLNTVIGAPAGYVYKPLGQLVGYPTGSTFALPDLRGRFPLGMDAMNNGLKVVTTQQNDQQSAGGGAIGRIGSAVTSQTIGGAAGTYQVTIAKGNLPAHTHTLKGAAGTQYYAVRPIAGAPQDGDAIAGTGPGTLATNQAQYLSNSGAISLESGETIGNAVGIMNPYLTINYIIFTGVI
jgi:microcystin-dependent protein